MRLNGTCACRQDRGCVTLDTSGLYPNPKPTRIAGRRRNGQNSISVSSAHRSWLRCKHLSRTLSLASKRARPSDLEPEREPQPVPKPWYTPERELKPASKPLLEIGSVGLFRDVTALSPPLTLTRIEPPCRPVWGCDGWKQWQPHIAKGSINVGHEYTKMVHVPVVIYFDNAPPCSPLSCFHA